MFRQGSRQDDPDDCFDLDASTYAMEFVVKSLNTDLSSRTKSLLWRRYRFTASFSSLSSDSGEGQLSS